MMDLKFAIVGCGRIAQRHAEHITKQGKLVAVCDTNKERRDEMAAKYNSKAYASLDELLQLNAKGLKSVSLLPLGYRDETNDYLVKSKKVRRAKEKLFVEVSEKTLNL